MGRTLLETLQDLAVSGHVDETVGNVATLGWSASRISRYVLLHDSQGFTESEEFYSEDAAACMSILRALATGSAKDRVQASLLQRLGNLLKPS